MMSKIMPFLRRGVGVRLCWGEINERREKGRDERSIVDS